MTRIEWRAAAASEASWLTLGFMPRLGALDHHVEAPRPPAPPRHARPGGRVGSS